MNINNSRSVIVRMIMAVAVALMLIAWKLDFFATVYLKGSLPTLGLAANGAILALFALGVGRMVQILLRYMREETALRNFHANLRAGGGDPTQGLDEDSMIAARYRSVRDLGRRGASLGHGALAAALVAEKSTETSFPKFVNNILILLGVLGTIVSLSIALLGASDMLAAAAEETGMATIIKAMSTALSTTMTAILCYLFFGYFYMKLTDVQTRLLAAIEFVTATVLVPQFQPAAEGLPRIVGQRMDASRALVERLVDSHKRYADQVERLTRVAETLGSQSAEQRQGIEDIRRLLREGFRLP